MSPHIGRFWRPVIGVLMCLMPPLAAQDSSSHSTRSGYVGIGFSVDPDSGVLTIERIVPGSPVEDGDVQVGDDVIGIGDRAVRFPSHRAALEFFAQKATVGAPLTLTLNRGGTQIETTVVPEESPASLAEQNERVLRCADGEDLQEIEWSRAFGQER